MSLIPEGRVVALVFLVLIVIFILYSINESLRGRKFGIKMIPALDALDEVIGRAVEMGRPVFINCGRAGITGQYVQQTVAGFNILDRVSKMCASLQIDLIHVVGHSEQLPSVIDIMTQGYKLHGAILDEEYSIRFVGNNQRAFMSTAAGIYEREKPAANILAGAYFWESIVLADQAAAIGAVQIAGTARIYQIPYFVALADYSFIGEELFAAGAYISEDERQLGSIRGQDLSKLLVILFVLLMLVSTLAGSEFLSSLLKM